MTSYYVLTTTERSIVDRNAPTSAAIDNAIASLRLYNMTMVGPRPRIVRRMVPAALRANETQVSWLVQRPVNQSLAVVQNYATERTANALRPLGEWSPVVVTEYAEPVNGPITWWQSGEAAVTRTRDAFPELGGRGDAPQNPVGPDNPLLRPSTVGESVGRGIEVITNAAGAGLRAAVPALWPIALGAAGVAGLIVFGPALAPVIAGAFTRRGQRTNPTPSKRQRENADRSTLPLALSAAAVVGGGYYLATTMGAAQAAALPGTPGGAVPSTAITTPAGLAAPPAVTPAPTPANPVPRPSLVPSLTPAERALSNVLITDPTIALRFYFQAMAYSNRLTDVAPDGRDGPDTRRLVNYVQGARGVPQTGVFTPAALSDYARLLDQARAGRSLRLIPMRLWVRAGEYVNGVAQAAAPGLPLLQYASLAA